MRQKVDWIPSEEEQRHWDVSAGMLLRGQRIEHLDAQLKRMKESVQSEASDAAIQRLREEVRNQSHYDFPIQLIDFLEAVLTPEEFRGHLRSLVLKYIVRFPHKGGLKDLAKAEDYMERLIKHEGKKSGI
jgi:hypothetical protein